MDTVVQRQARVLDCLRGETDPRRRLERLMDLVAEEPVPPTSMRTEEHLVEGCLAALWFRPSFREGRCYFQSASDSRIIGAVAGVLCGVYNGAEPGEILAHPPVFLREAGVTEHLTANRRNALTRVWGLIRRFALECETFGKEGAP